MGNEAWLQGKPWFLHFSAPHQRMQERFSDHLLLGRTPFMQKVFRQQSAGFGLCETDAARSTAAHKARGVHGGSLCTGAVEGGSRARAAHQLGGAGDGHGTGLGDGLHTEFLSV
jgi:hypothetical protein